MSMDGPVNPPEPQDRCMVHGVTWCDRCWPPDIEDDRREHEARDEGRTH